MVTRGRKQWKERCDVRRGAWVVGGDFGGWDIRCSCVSLSGAVGEGAVGEGVLWGLGHTVFLCVSEWGGGGGGSGGGASSLFPSPHAPAWDPESEGAEG